MKKLNEKGSFTIEAILSLSIFMFAFVAIISLATVAKIESTTQYAINQTAKEISRYCYIADRAAIAAGLNPNVTPDTKKHKLEIMQLEHKNALESNEKQQSNAAMFSVMSDVITNPKKLQGLMDLANNPAVKK